MTQEARLLEYLKTHDAGIKPLEALQELGIYRLSARIKDLRNHGHNIVTNKVAVATAHGGTAWVAEYRLVKNE